MKEFIEKLIGRLEEEKNTAYNTYNRFEIKVDLGRGFGMEKAIEIANQLVEEYNNGWIPCIERLPEEDGKYIVTVKNLTGRWIMKNNVFVCNYWDDDFHFQGWEDNEVIAWQPLPAPYKEGNNDEN